MVSRVVRRAALGAVLVLLSGACEIKETTTAVAEPVVVVEAVLRPDLAVQTVKLRWSQSGTPAPEPPLSDCFDTSSGDVLCPSAFAIRGATVSMQPLDRLNPGCDSVIFFAEGSGLDRGSYFSQDPCLVPLQSGERIALRVEVDGGDGQLVTGTTRVPGIDQVRVLLRGTPLSLDLVDNQVNRDRDTLQISVAARSGRAMSVKGGRLDLMTDSMGMTLPVGMADPLNDGRQILAAGFRYPLVVGVADSNLYDFTRSFSDPITGRGFINHLSGGIGVFGAMAVARYALRVVADPHDPRDGRIHLSHIDTTNTATLVDIDWEGYIVGTGDARVNAFFKGVWLGHGIDQSVSGQFRKDSLFVQINQRDPSDSTRSRRYLMAGFFNANQLSTMKVIDTLGRTVTVLQAVRQ